MLQSCKLDQKIYQLQEWIHKQKQKYAIIKFVMYVIYFRINGASFVILHFYVSKRICVPSVKDSH